MILIDTSVWIDYFAGKNRPHVDLLDTFINSQQDLALCGIVLTEILQGINDDRTHDRVKRYLRPLVMLPMRTDVFVKAAEIYRTLRKNGLTIRSSNDCIIAATALQHQCQLLHNDKDFSYIAGQYPLQVAE